MTVQSLESALQLRSDVYKRQEHIRGILGHNRMDVEDFSATHALHVKHAYEVRI